jgi:hypothetical protein
MRLIRSWFAFLPIAAISVTYSACGGGDNSNNGDDGGSDASMNESGGGDAPRDSTGGDGNGGNDSGKKDSGGGNDSGGEAGDDSGGDSGGDTGTDTGGGDGGGVTGASVLQHHKNPNRDGFYVDAALKKSAISTMHLDPNFNATTSGQNFSDPLFMEGGVNGKDAIFVATENNDVFALDATTGAQLWTTNLGTTSPLNTFQCGGIDPIGSTGTPIIDAASRTLFVAGAILVNGAPRYNVFGLSVDTGAIAWTVDVQAKINGFDSTVQSQRSALSLLGGKVFVPFGGLDGDCGNYHGWVVGIPLANPQSPTSWSTAAPSGSGIWGPSGIASDGTSLFAATGNVNGPDPTWSNTNSEALVKLSTAPAFSGQAADYFAPSDWYTNLDMSDADLGSSGVVIFDAPNANPSHLAFVMGKSQTAYILDRTNLAGITNGVSKLGGNGMTFGAMFSYSTAAGTYVGMHQTFSSQNCNGGDFAVLGVSNAAQLSVAWCASSGGGGDPISSSTSPDGSTDSIVWSFGAAGDGTLRAWDADTGMNLFTAGAGVNGNVQHWTSPIIAKGRIYVAGDGAVYAFTL